MTDGMKMRSTPWSAKSRTCPWTSFAGKHTVSEDTAESPRSYMARVLGRDSFTVKPSERNSVVQKGAYSHIERTRGMPMTVFCGAGLGVQGQSRKRNFSRTSNRFGTLSTAAAMRFNWSRMDLSFGSPTTSPRGQRLPVTHESPFAKVMRVRLQWFAQKGQMRLDSCVYEKASSASREKAVARAGSRPSLVASASSQLAATAPFSRRAPSRCSCVSSAMPIAPMSPG